MANETARAVMRQSEPALGLLRLCVLFLGFAVVFWGSHDKVSLYKRVAGTGAPVAKAKLLAGREQAVRASAPAPIPAPSFALLLFSALLRLLFEVRSRRINPSGFSRPLTPSPPLSHALRRRPPPFASGVFA